MKAILLKALPVILLLSVGLSLGYLIAPKQDKSIKKEFERQKKELLSQIQQNHILQKRLASHDSVWTKIVQLHKDSLILERKTTTRLHNENKRLKNRPVPNWSAPELDSIISSIIR